MHKSFFEVRLIGEELVLKMFPDVFNHVRNPHYNVYVKTLTGLFLGFCLRMNENMIKV